MQHQISQKEAIFRFAKIFIAQYLSSVHNYDSFQGEALNMLAHYMLQIIRSLASEVKKILNLQGRTLPNSLHLLVVAQQKGLFDFPEFLNFMVKRRQKSIDVKSLEVIERMGKKMFENDMETVNNYEKEKKYANIRYIPAIYLTNLNKKALPYKHPVDEAFEMPPEITYKQTKESLKSEPKNIELLTAYTKRETKMAMTGFSQGLQKEKAKREKERQKGIEEYFGVNPTKKMKFNDINYI